MGESLHLPRGWPPEEATARATPPPPAPPASIGGRSPEAGGCSEEDTVARRLYYQDSYGRTHRARSAERCRGLPGGLFAKALIALAVLVVLAQFVH